MSELITKDPTAAVYSKDPKKLFDEAKVDAFMNAVNEVLRTIVIDLNYEVKATNGDSDGDGDEIFDYKSDLKSPKKIARLKTEIIKSYEKEVARKKISALGESI
ncbi:MAG: hypothetical protein ACFHX7_12395 [Pseudomonadota bacterium]